MTKEQTILIAIIAFIIIAILAVSLVTLFSPQSAIITGLMVTSISVVDFIEDDTIGDSKFIINVIVNGASDAVIGSATKTKEQLTSEAEGNPVKFDFKITANKTKNNIIVPISISYVQKYLDKIELVYHGMQSSACGWYDGWGQPTSASTAQQLATSMYAGRLSALSDEGIPTQNYLGFAWRRAGDETTGCLAGQHRVKVMAYSYYKRNWAKIYNWDLSHKQIEWETKFTLTGKTTKTITLTNDDYLKAIPIGDGYGTIKWFANSLGNYLPPQIQPIYPGWLVDQKKWVTTPIDFGTYSNNLNDFKNRYNRLTLTDNLNDAIFSRSNHNTEVIRLLGQPQPYNLSSSQITLSIDSAINPQFQITLKAAFVGIERKTTKPVLNCSNTRISKNAGETHQASISIKNDSDSTGSIILVTNCGGTGLSYYLTPNNWENSYTSRQTRNFTFNITSGTPTSVSCSLWAKDGTDPSIQSTKCNLTGAFKQVNLCGNGWCDQGETFQTCPQDCDQPAVCGNTYCEAGETPQNCSTDCGCGNRICQEGIGENCTTCSTDCGQCPPPECNKNKVCEPLLGETIENCSTDCGCNHNNTCEIMRGETIENCGDCEQPKEEIPWLIIAAIIIIGGAIGGTYYAYKKGYIKI